jgi:hypothetical protein
MLSAAAEAGGAGHRKSVGEVKLNCSNDPTKKRGCKDMNGYRHVKFNFIEELTFKCNSGSYFLMLKFFIIKIIPYTR